MNETGYFWYDRAEPFGNVALPDVNTDMISEAFWLVKGEEFKITQSNDVHHTSLLSTVDIIQQYKALVYPNVTERSKAEKI